MECLAAVEKKEEEFRHFMDSCVTKTVEELNEYCAEESEVLLSTLTKRYKHMREDELDNEELDSWLLFEMSIAGVHYKEPVFVKRRSTLIKFCH